jgi:hypothetical protein
LICFGWFLISLLDRREDKQRKWGKIFVFFEILEMRQAAYAIIIDEKKKEKRIRDEEEKEEVHHFHARLKQVIKTRHIHKTTHTTTTDKHWKRMILLMMMMALQMNLQRTSLKTTHPS